MKLVHLKKYLLIILIILTSCTKRIQLSDQERLKIKIQTARLSDVPIPFGAKPMLEYIDDFSFAYLIDDNQIDLLEYYALEMDQNGWQLIGKFRGLEHNLVFEKPYKLMSIIIRKQDKAQFVLILTSDK